MSASGGNCRYIEHMVYGLCREIWTATTIKKSKKKNWYAINRAHQKRHRWGTRVFHNHYISQYISVRRNGACMKEVGQPSGVLVVGCPSYSYSGGRMGLSGGMERAILLVHWKETRMVMGRGTKIKERY